MRITFPSALAAVLVALSMAGPTWSDQSNTSVSSDGSAIVFVPPESGKPSDRAGAGTRDLSADEGIVELLVPDGGGVTTMAKPPLVWRLTERFVGTVKSEIAEVGKSGSGVSREDAGRFRPGWYGLDLARSTMTLVPGGLYEWKVTLIDSESNAVVHQDITYVERLAEGTLAKDSAQDQLVGLAAAGLWFDALNRLIRIDLSGSATVLFQTDFDTLLTSASLQAK